MSVSAFVAYFNDAAARDAAVQQALASDGPQVRLVGMATVIVKGQEPYSRERPFVIFFGDMMSALFFMQHGATSSGPLY